MIEMLMTKKDVAKHFGKSEKTIEKWITSNYTKLTSDYTKQVDRLLKHGTV